MTKNTNLDQLLVRCTSRDGCYQPIPEMGKHLIDYLVAAHLDTNWEGFTDEQIAAYERLAEDINTYLDNV